MRGFESDHNTFCVCMKPSKIEKRMYAWPCVLGSLVKQDVMWGKGDRQNTPLFYFQVNLHFYLGIFCLEKFMGMEEGSSSGPNPTPAFCLLC